MHKIREASIRVKLIVGFLIVNLVLLSIGIVGILNITKINNNAESMHGEYLKSLDELHEIRGNMLEIDINLQHIKYTRILNEIGSLAEDIDALNLQTDQILSSYESRKMDDREITLWQDLRESLATYRTERNEALDSIIASQGLASSGTIDELGEASGAVLAAINQVLNLNQELADERNIENHNIYKVAFGFMIALVAIGALISIG